jgi:hypothetical protein
MKDSSNVGCAIAPWVLLASVMWCASPANAACPAAGSVQLTYKDVSVPLPAAPDDYVTLISDDCTRTLPPATLVSAKLQLDNRATVAQTVECRMGTEKSWDYGKVTVPAQGSASLALFATNPAGSLAGLNLTTGDCRSVEANSAGNVSASWIKLLTESVDSVHIVGPQP